MPRFDYIGFFVPLLIALIYAPIGVFQLRSKVLLYFVATGLLTYAFPIWHAEGVGFLPFYPLYALVYIGRGLRRKSESMGVLVPLSTLVSLSFLSVAVPDFFRTWEGGGVHWAVGGAGWHDGLIKFWLYIVSLAVPVFIGIEWVRARDEGRHFCLLEWTKFHISPWPASRSNRSARDDA